MFPRSKWARILFWVVYSCAALLLLASVSATIWSQVGYEGWVSKAVIAFVLWTITVPVVLASGAWLVALGVKKKRSAEKSP